MRGLMGGLILTTSLIKMIENLITLDEIPKLSGEDIVGQICTRLYNEDNWHIRDVNIFCRLPVVLKDIILMIDFDIELNMNGILGFLENSSGLYIDDTIDMLNRINDIDDFHILRHIRDIMKKYNASAEHLRDNVNKGPVYEISSFCNARGSDYCVMADEIVEAAQGLYIYDKSRNAFDYLFEYVEINKELLIHSIITQD